MTPVTSLITDIFPRCLPNAACDMIEDMPQSRIEPGLIRIFRYFMVIAMVYYALVIGFTALQTGLWNMPQQVLLYVNFGTNLILFVYLSFRWLEQKLGV